MAYTGSDYFMKVKLSGDTQAKVRDHDLNEKLAAKGSMLVASANASGDLAQLDTLAIGESGQVLSVSNGMPAWTSASAAAGVNDANLDIELNGGTASKLFSANASNAATLSFAEGSTNGAIAVNGTAIPVHGLGSAAFEDASAFDTAGAADDALQDAKDYVDEKIGDLGNVMSVVGTGATLPASSENQGDVYIINSGTDAGKEYVWTGSAWELLGQNEIDLSGYVPTSRTINGQALTTNISLTYSDIGAAAANHTHSYSEITGAPTDLGDFTNNAGYVTQSDITFPVTDVQVKNPNDADYSSVVSSGVANIDLSGFPTIGMISGLASQSDVAAIAFAASYTSGLQIGTFSNPSSSSTVNVFVPITDLATALTPELGGLAVKDNVSVPANTFVTGISATTTAQTVSGVDANGASKISAWNAGSAAFGVTNGVLELNFVAPTLSYTAATTSTLATININSYSATMNNSMTLS